MRRPVIKALTLAILLSLTASTTLEASPGLWRRWCIPGAPISQTTPADNPWQSAAYGNGTFVAVATTGTSKVMTSPDGITWTARTVANIDTPRSIAFGNGVFVAVGGSTNQVLTSSDGITWTVRTPSTTGPFTWVSYGNGLFVASGDGGRLMSSTDGITWTTRTAYSTSNIYSTQWSGDRLLLGLDGAVAYKNGIAGTATLATYPAGSSRRYIIRCHNDLCLAATGTSVTSSSIMRSTDGGLNWSNVTLPLSPTTTYWRALDYANGAFILASYTTTSGYFYASFDGLTWTELPGDGTNRDRQWMSIAYDGLSTLVYLAASGTAQRVRRSLCTGPTNRLITVTTATYWHTSCGKIVGNMTSLVGTLCNGLTTCNLSIDQFTLTPDPCYGQVKSFEATYNCGAANKTVSGTENTSVTFSCP